MFNIFNVLSVADKELVHSSIIKLLIDEKELNFTKTFWISMPFQAIQN